MPLTRLDNLLSSKTGKYIYVSPDDFNATDALDNRGNTPLRPFVTIQRAFLEVARYSYVPGVDNDRFDQFTIMLSPGTHYVDNRPGDLDTADIPVFDFNANTGEWNDSSILDLANPNNIFYRFNGRDGGATIPRGTSLVGTDLRRTQVRALYIPEPADKDVPRCALFNVTGGCYFWQFTILDAQVDGGPLNGKAYSQPGSTLTSTPLFSHHKMTNFVFADKEDLSLLYRKIAKCFSKYQTAIDDVYAKEISVNSGRVSDTWDASPTKTYAQNDTVVFGGNAYQAITAHTSSSDKRPDKNKTFWKILTTVSREFDYAIRENRIVGPLADTIQIDDITISEFNTEILNVKVRTKINHNLFPSQYVVVANTGFSSLLSGSFEVVSISETNPKEFTFRVRATLAQVSFANNQTQIPPDSNASIQAEVDSVESASPYVFNVSIRSTWGICGIWADGRKATGFKSMVIAQYTGVSLQKDDRAFIRYDEFTNTWNQAPLTDAFATTPYHIKGDAYWKDDWRNFHVRASDDSFIQNVSIFAVGFADHFLLESGGDMSITNSNSNFGNTSMHSKGFKGFAFNQDKGGYITDIIPPQAFTSTPTTIKTSYYPFDVQLTRGNKDSGGSWLAQPRLYLTGDKSNDPLDRPAVSINGYKLGTRTYINDTKAEKIYTKISADTSAGETQPTIKEAYVYPQGFKKWTASLTTLSPGNLGVGNFDNNPATDQIADKAFYNRCQDAANLIDANKTFIQAEAFGYVLEKYPYLQDRQYVNPNITAETGRYRDGSNIIKANRQEIIDYAFSQMRRSFFTAITTTSTAPAPILTAITRSGTTLTINTSGTNGVEAGDTIKIAGANQSDYNGTFIVLASPAPTNTSFAITLPNASTSATPATGSITVSVPFLTPPSSGVGNDSAKCKRDIGYIVDAIADDLYNGGNANIINATKSYFGAYASINSVSRTNNTATITTSSPHNLAVGAVVAINCSIDSFDNTSATIASIPSPTTFTYVNAGSDLSNTATGTVSTESGSPITNGLVGEETQSIFAFNRVKDWSKKAISNLLNYKSLLTVTSITSSGTTVTVTVNASNPHGLKAGDYVTVGGATQTAYNGRWKILSTGLTTTQFRYTALATPSAATATGAYYVSTVTIDAENALEEAGRYKDASRLVTANRQEIIDRAYAQVAIEYDEVAWGLNWVVPGDPTTDNYSRFQDAYRLIQKNRQEIIDRSFGEIAVQYSEASWGTNWVVPGDSVTTNLSRYLDAYRLIQRNRNIIVETAYATVVASPPSPAPANLLSKCKRDIGYFVDALSLDILLGGGNVYTRKFTQTYFSNNTTLLTNGLVGEVTQSITAFNKARDAIKSAITNTLSAFAGVVTTSPAGGTWVDGTSGTQTVYADLTISAGPATFGGGGGNIANNNSAACADVRLAVDTLTAIVSTALNNVNLSTLPAESNGITEGAGELKCMRDIGYLIDAVSLDIMQGSGNRYTRKFIEQYFTNASTPLSSGLVGEEAQSNIAFNMARDMMRKAVTNQLYYKDLTLTAGPADHNGAGGNIPVDQSGNSASCNDVQTAISTLTLIATDRITAGNLTTAVSGRSYPVETIAVNAPGETKCKRDLGYIVDSIAQDLFWGGNEFTIDAIKEYYTNNTTLLTTGLTGELPQSIVAFNAAKDMVKKAVTNQLYSKNLLLSTGPATYGGAGGNVTYNLSGNSATCVDVQATVDNLFGIITTTLNNGNLNSLPQLSNGQWDCANVRASIDTLTAIITTTLKEGSLANLPPVNPGLWSQVSEASKCKRDIGYIVEAVTSDLRLGGNENTVNAAESYYTGTGNFTVTGTISATGVVTGISSTSNLQAGMSVFKTSGTGNFGDNAIIGSVDGLSQVTIVISSGSFTAGSITFTANQLDYIENERVETLDAYDYVKQLMISSMRNHNTYIPSGNVSFSTSSSTITLTGGKTTAGLVVGMKVQSVTTIPSDTGTNSTTNYNDALEEIVDGRVVAKSSNVTTRIPSNTYIKKIISSTQFELGEKGSKLNIGLTKNPFSGSNANLFFSFDEGTWSSALDPSVDNTVIQVYNEYSTTNGECANIKTALDTYFVTINTIINNGIGQVSRIPSTINTGTFAQRATLFTLTDSDSPTNPHFLQTGTPVRLVPKAKAGAVVDKRLIRLPKGFNTNTVYYAIAPGRITDPYDYSTTTAFNGAAGSLQNMLLATSIENAAAGIFVYSSETEAVDSDIEIDVYQYLLDLKYDLNKYETSVKVSNLEILVTSEPHVFDIPTTSDTLTDTQKYTSVFFRPISGGLPSISGGTTLDPNKEYYVRYVSKNEFKVYDTLTAAVNTPGSPIVFTSGFNSKFYVVSNKRRSPLRYDPTATNATTTQGTWFVQTDPSKLNTILTRIRSTDFETKDKTPDSWFERLADDRTKEDRIYRLRYVIPKYLRSVRDPLRGFVIKSRTDSTRKLQPQKILLKPTAAGNSFAQFSIPNTTAAAPGLTSGKEYLGLDINSQGPNFVSQYDPYNPELQDPTQPLVSPQKFRVRKTTDGKVTFYVQSAKKKRVNNKDYLELTVFDVGIEEQGYKQKIFTSIEINPPQGGDGVFVSNISNLPANDTSTDITWTGATEGSARVHAYYNYEGKHYLVLKDVNTITSSLAYNPFQETIFTQGLVSSALISEPDFGRSSSERYLYVTEGANVYTMTPGDTLTDDTGVSYTIADVEDIQDFDNTFYIYDVNTIRRRIFGQQDGIYYLSCIRGNISPYPTGSGVGENFRDFKFSQPISKLYPEFYKDDPEWYKQIDSTLIDPPATTSAADNYIHGLVTVNDAKGSLTRECITDFVKDAGSRQYNFSGNIVKDGKVIDVSIKSQEGTASAGSEGRKIPISGNSLFPLEQRLYVELRRPSIARSGNHTFEYLGFGPGNYSTGFPLRQEVVLSDIEDFYAQAKRENGGIVFYTGLNSNGDLYIGNRKINAITGEETFLESAELVSSSDEGDTIGNFVTTFDGPVTFNDKVSFLAPISRSPIVFQAPVQFDVPATDPQSPTLALSPASIEILTNIATGDDSNLATNTKTGRGTGPITLTSNRIKSAIFQFNARGLQNYSIRSAVENWTPNQLNPYGTANESQIIDFGSRYPLLSGDILLKGEQVSFTGSLGWVYANNFVTITHTSTASRLSTLVGYGAGSGNNKIRLNWAINPSTSTPYTNSQIGISSSNFQVRIFGSFSGAQGTLASKVFGTWSIISSSFSTSNTYIELQIVDFVDVGTYTLAFANEPNIGISFSNNSWKEVGVIGAEVLRTETDNIGNYKLGINTVARAATSAYKTAFVDPATTSPRANLDVVGDAFISGKSQPAGSSFETTSSKTETGLINGFLVGGFSSSPSRVATLRVDTLNNRIGINTTKPQIVSQVARASNIATITTASTHGYVAGDKVTVVITGTTYNTFNVVEATILASPAPTASAFSYSNTGTTVTSIALPNGTTGSVTKSSNDLDRSLVVGGNARITGDFMFESDINVNGGDITTTVTTTNFNFLNQSTYVGSITDTAGVITTTGLNIANFAASINIGTNRTDDQYINIANVSDQVNVRIGNNTAITSSNVSKINIGGAFNNNESQSYVSFDSKLTRVGGDLALSYLRGLGSSLRITVPAGSTLEAFNDATSLNLANNASTVVIGGQGGDTTIRNSLVVDASIKSNGNIILNGGLSAFTFNGNRAQLGTTRQSVVGTSAAPLDKPVDLVTIVNGFFANPTYYVNEIDTGGAGDWGSTEYQTAITGIVGGEPSNLPALSGKNYYLPLRDPVTYNEGDYLLIDTIISGSRHPEIVRIPIGGLVRSSVAPYYIIVERQPLGVFTPIRIDHPDNPTFKTPVRKINVAFDATWITNNIDNSGTSDVYNLSEFGGSLTIGDYIIVNRNVAGTTGEFVKITTTVDTLSRKLTINNGQDPALTVFEVDSVTGNTTIGNQTISNSGNLTIYGSLNLAGGCGNGSTTSDRRLTFRNELYETVNINTCTGDAVFGSQYATVFTIGGFYGTTLASHSVTDPVYVYRRNPFTVQTNGPITTILANSQTGSVTPATSNIPIATNLNAFAVGDLVAIIEGLTKIEIIQITDTPFTDANGNKLLPTSTNSTYPSGGRGKETTTAKSWNSGVVVVKIDKDPRTTTLSEAIPATGRVAVELPNTNPNKIRMRLVNGDLVAEKLDYEYIIRINSELFFPDSKAVSSSGTGIGANDPQYGVRLPKSYRDPVSGQITKFFGGGDITTHGDLNITSGNFRMYGSDGKTLILNVANDDGHPGDGAILDETTGKDGMYLNGFANIFGNLQVYNQQCQETGICQNKLVFKVDRKTGSIIAGESLTLEGQLFGIESPSTKIFEIKNLGSAGSALTGPKKFTMYQDGSVDAFGITQYFTANGGRRWTYVSQSATGLGQTQSNPLQPNNNYLLNLTSGGNMVLYLPTNAVTGDVIRFVELTGNLDYRTNLIIRALRVNNTAVGIQGDTIGTKLTAGSASSLLATPWDSGELIVQTRNASFGLLYVSNTDSPNDPNASEIPSNLRGWWLVEL